MPSSSDPPCRPPVLAQAPRGRRAAAIRHRRHIRRTARLVPALACCLLPALAAGPVDEVNPFIGTGGHGHTHPAATLPF
ncbi:MAG: hypothetical protein PVF68_15815, partial [Acidobacteriota bacterium]